MPIITPPTPDPLNPWAFTGLLFSADLINAAWDQANAKASAFESKVDGIESVLNTAITPITADIANETAVVEPAITIPSSASVSDVMGTFDAKYMELVALLAGKFTDFQTSYFPNDSTTYAAAETWVTGAMANPDGAIPAAIAAQLLTDDKSRAYADAAVQSDAVLATFAARRFPLPPGAAASAVMQINQKAQDSIAESSRKLMMAYIENMKFAVEKALSMRQQAMSAAIDYIRALASGPDMASRITGVGYDAQSKLISSVAGFYGARIDANKLVKQAEQFNVTTKLHKDEKNQSVEVLRVEERVKALLVEAQSIAQMATALFNNLHASSNVNTTSTRA